MAGRMPPQAAAARGATLLGGTLFAVLGTCAGFAAAMRPPPVTLPESLCVSTSGGPRSVPGYPTSPRAKLGHIRVRQDLPPASVL